MTFKPYIYVIGIFMFYIFAIWFHVVLTCVIAHMLTHHAFEKNPNNFPKRPQFLSQPSCGLKCIFTLLNNLSVLNEILICKIPNSTFSYYYGPNRCDFAPDSG